MRGVFEKIKNALHEEDLEFMQQADLMACIDSIIDKVASDDKNGWIHIADELPETGEMVLGLRNDGDIWLYNFRRWDHESGGFYRNIINRYAQSTLPDDSVMAWQPIPDPLQNEYKQKKTNFDRCCESLESMAQIIDIAKIGWTKEQIMDWLQKEVCEIPEPCSEVLSGNSMTNADRIRSMSDKEFAEFWLKSCDNPIMNFNEDICDLCDVYGNVSGEKCDDDYCIKAILKWLQSEVEE